MTGGGNATGNANALNTTTMQQTVTGGNASSSPTGGGNETSTANVTETNLAYITSGDWSLDVKDGSVSNFEAKFTMVHIDGTGRHSHELSNFVSSNAMALSNQTSTSNATGTTTGANMTGGTNTTAGNATSGGNMTTSTQQQTVTGGNASSNQAAKEEYWGKVDVTTNGQPKWTGVTALIVIAKNNVISISLASAETEGHFMGQPIYGIVESMTDANGNELVATGNTQTAGNATSGAAVGNATGGNQTGGSPAGGFLGNLTQGIQNLTGGNKP